MGRKDFFAVLLVACLGLCFTPSPYTRVKTVYDGDTVLLETGEKVRYLGIDAPEMGYGSGREPEFAAIEAREMNRRLVEGKRVRLEPDGEPEDRYGRKLAYVYLEDGTMANAEMVKRGLAFVFFRGPDAKHFSPLLHHQRSAMEKKVGIWSREVSSPERHYVGNAKSFTFHRPGCARAKEISRHRRVLFDSRRSAFREGFHPCRQCMP